MRFTILCQLVNGYQQIRGTLCLPCKGQATFGLSDPEDEITRPHRDVDNCISVNMTSYPITEDSS